MRSVALAAEHRDRGKPAFGKWLNTTGPGVRCVPRQDLREARVARMDGMDRVARMDGDPGDRRTA